MDNTEIKQLKLPRNVVLKMSPISKTLYQKRLRRINEKNYVATLPGGHYSIQKVAIARYEHSIKGQIARAKAEDARREKAAIKRKLKENL